MPGGGAGACQRAIEACTPAVQRMASIGQELRAPASNEPSDQRAPTRRRMSPACTALQSAAMAENVVALKQRRERAPVVNGAEFRLDPEPMRSS
jgi:C4-dicarboxylate-specific signal transduction histidine kinase